jgi:hypothetical protein
MKEPHHGGGQVEYTKQGRPDVRRLIASPSLTLPLTSGKAVITPPDQLTNILCVCSPGISSNVNFRHAIRGKPVQGSLYHVHVQSQDPFVTDLSASTVGSSTTIRGQICNLKARSRTHTSLEQAGRARSVLPHPNTRITSVLVPVKYHPDEGLLRWSRLKHNPWILHLPFLSTLTGTFSTNQNPYQQFLASLESLLCQVSCAIADANTLPMDDELSIGLINCGKETPFLQPDSPCVWLA